MKKRLAALQQKLDGAIKAYREHIGAEPSAADVEAHAKKTAELKTAMDRASQAIADERAAIEAEQLLEPVAVGVDREPSITGGEDRSAQDPRGGFRTIAEFVRAVFGASSRGNGAIDKRLVLEAAAPTTYGNESTGADGGYLVPPEFARNIFQHSLDEGSFLPLTNQLPISGNSITFPKDETTPWGTNGIRMRWSSEAVAAGQDKPVLGEDTLKLRKLIGLVPLTDELVADAQASAAYVNLKFGQSLAWKTNDAIINGIGGQIPLGIRNAGSIITVAAEGGQTADTVVTPNVAKMLSRLLPASLASSRTRWLLNNDVIPQITTLTIGNQPVWTPPNAGLKEAPLGYLLGRPIVPTQVCQTIGDLGDIMLIDFNQYVTISKGPEYAESMHLFFDADAMAFRVVFRMDGRPWLTSAVSPANGASTLSPFVQLAAR